MPLMTSQIFKSLDFTKTQKSRYLENETLFLLQIKKTISNTCYELIYGKKNSFVAEVTFKRMCVASFLFQMTEEHDDIVILTKRKAFMFVLRTNTN